jgi:succinoglycan biosynthesis transport protein ExoP
VPTSPLNSPVTDFLELLRRHRLGIVATMAVLAAVFFPFIAAMPNLYRATAKVLVEGQPEPQGAPGMTEDVETRLGSIKQLAFSRQELKDLADRHHLHEELRRDGSDDARIERLQREIKIERVDSDQPAGKDSTIAFRLSYLGTDPGTAAAVANSLANFYVSQNSRIKASVATHNSELLAKQLEDARQLLEQQSGKLRQYTAANSGTLPQQSEGNIAALEHLNTQLRLNGEEQGRLMERRQTLQNQIANEMSANDEVRKPVPANPNDPEQRLASLKAELADLKTKWTDASPDVRDVQQKIAALEPVVAASQRSRNQAAGSRVSPLSTLQSAVNETNAELQRLAKENQALSASIAGYQSRLDAAPLRGQQLLTLARDEQVTRDTYDSLLKRYNEAALAERADTGGQQGFRILDAAVPPESPAGPDRRTLMLLGLALVIAGGLGAAFLLEKFDGSFRSVQELREFTTLPVLASIPDMADLEDRSASRRRALALAGAGMAMIAVMAVAAFWIGRSAEPVVRILMRLG